VNSSILVFIVQGYQLTYLVVTYLIVLQFHRHTIIVIEKPGKIIAEVFLIDIVQPGFIGQANIIISYFTLRGLSKSDYFGAVINFLTAIV